MTEPKSPGQAALKVLEQWGVLDDREVDTWTEVRFNELGRDIAQAAIDASPGTKVAEVFAKEFRAELLERTVECDRLALANQGLQKQASELTTERDQLRAKLAAMAESYGESLRNVRDLQEKIADWQVMLECERQCTREANAKLAAIEVLLDWLVSRHETNASYCISGVRKILGGGA